MRHYGVGVYESAEYLIRRRHLRNAWSTRRRRRAEGWEVVVVNDDGR
jgi:hypothetical protein